ncbi:hypothetical protein ABFO63_14755 [Acinetobacter junii]|uniref:hypothetical protein n=1 Tax=Acinetobacter junii TaxID=40215 RepID=UPI000E90F878|nr:hypothetical protein [Acinetobacter junii]
MQLIYTPKSGKLAGLAHTPHQNKDGLYIVSKDRFLINYIYVETLEEVYSYLKKGLKVRMSHKQNAPSLINLKSIRII